MSKRLKPNVASKSAFRGLDWLAKADERRWGVGGVSRRPSVNGQVCLATRYRGSGGNSRGLARVGRAMPAITRGNLVSIECVTEGFHMLVPAVMLDRTEVPLLVNRDGWLPLLQLPTSEPLTRARDRNGRRAVFGFSMVGVPDPACALVLSPADQQKIMASVMDAGGVGELMRPVFELE